MAFNSDGYIMIDFTDVDFRRTNQTIEGLYKRCVDVIGTNKFILVINANGRTPLPATCSFTNNQYVIDTVIYMFAVSSNDNLFIRRNDVPASDIIDDSSISVDKTWSSNKIDSELDTKADTSALADYQPKLTAGTNITIDENNVISASGGAVIDDSVIVNNKVWSSLNTVENLAPIDTIINNPAEFKTSLALPLVECSTSFAATQEGTGDPSPTNVRPIVGVDVITFTANGVDNSKNLGDEFFGGSYNAVSGVLRKTWVNTQIKDLEIGYSTQNNYFFVLNVKKFGNDNLMSDILKYEAASVGSMSNYSLKGNGNNGNIYIKATDFTTVEALKEAIGDYYIAYELIEPIETNIGATTIITNIGNNTISADTNNIKVSYRHLPIDLI